MSGVCKLIKYISDEYKHLGVEETADWDQGEIKKKAA